MENNNTNSNGNLIELYKEMNTFIRSFADREWETLKFFTTIFLALLTAYTSIISYLNSTSQTDKISNLIFFPIFMIGISILGWYNFRREVARLFERVASVAKLEKELGFHKKRLKNSLPFQNDDYLVPSGYVTIDANINGKKTTENFVKGMLTFRIKNREYGDAYSTFTLVFAFYIFISFLLIIIFHWEHILNLLSQIF